MSHLISKRRVAATFLLTVCILLSIYIGASANTQSVAHPEIIQYEEASNQLWLPVAMNDHCFAPVVDSFDSASSGWPVGDTGSAIFRYLNGEYNIFHRNENRWTAVSRGDIWDEAKELTINGRVANERAVWGLVYGLNEDWSDFYTLEILPHRKEWYHLHFNARTGWELITMAKSSAINELQATNQLSIVEEGTYQSFFKINGTKIIQIYPPAGRVGITGGSFATNTDIRYDNYLFVSKDCPLPNQQNVGLSTQNSILLDRPNLDALIEDNN